MTREEEDKLIKAARNAYLRAWRRRNPDKVREHSRRQWLKKAMQEMGRHSVTDNRNTTVTRNATTVTRNTDAHLCPVCGSHINGSRRAKYCSPACRQKHYRLKQKKEL